MCQTSRTLYTGRIRSAKPPFRPQHSAYAYNPLVNPELPNPRCRLQLRSPGTVDTLPGESVIDTLN